MREDIVAVEAQVVVIGLVVRAERGDVSCIRERGRRCRSYCTKYLVLDLVCATVRLRVGLKLR